MAIFTDEYCEYVLYNHNKIEFSSEEFNRYVIVANSFNYQFLKVI